MVREAQYAESTADFVHKLKIAQKELGETFYWLELLKETNFINEQQFKLNYNLTEQVIKMITSTIKTIKEKKYKKLITSS